MITIDPHDRIDLTGPWAGFGFQGGHMFTPKGHQLDPCDMAWWSWSPDRCGPERLMHTPVIRFCRALYAPRR
ncbi:hypothetical protein CR156_08715 [Stenotrophomonas lactitubi]|nr:hypothetical protein CR156_08715 [Stenotrophomonas lactitubi]